MQTATPATVPNTPTPPRAQRLRSAKALARAVVRDLRRQDEKEQVSISEARDEIRAWRTSASMACDAGAVDAIDLLGLDEAARAYALGPRNFTLSSDETEKLARAAKKARGW